MAFLSVPSLLLSAWLFSLSHARVQLQGWPGLCDCFGFSPVSAARAHSPVRNAPPPTMTTTSGRWPSRLSRLCDGHFCPQCCWVWLFPPHRMAWLEPFPSQREAAGPSDLPRPGKPSCPLSWGRGRSTTDSQVPV